jgi:peptidyl-prolyl cis-trans isomerase B (cyclophilin B)
LLALVVTGCGKTTKPESIYPNGAGTVVAKDPTLKDEAVPPPAAESAKTTDKPQPAAKEPAKPVNDNKPPVATDHIVIKTVRGTMEAELYGKDAPETVKNFVKLIKMKFYDNLTFHRVESNPAFSLIQGGDPNGNGTGDSPWKIKLEISPKLRHWKGALAMARSNDPNSASCQFYICRVAIPQLNDGYAVFGKVTKGLEVADKIQVNDKIISIRLK